MLQLPQTLAGPQSLWFSYAGITKAGQTEPQTTAIVSNP